MGNNFIWIVLLLTGIWTKELLANSIVLRIGESQTIAGLGKIWVEDSKVVTISDLGSKISVKGSKPGSTVLKIGNSYHQIFVLSPNQEKTWQVLNSQIKLTLGLDLKNENGKILIKGKLLRWQDWQKIFRTCLDINCEYSLESIISEDLKRTVQIKINDIFKNHGLPPQNLIFDNGVQTLVSTSGEVSRSTVKLLKAFGIKPIFLKSNLDLVPMVKVQITVAEVRKDHSLNYGIKWPESYSAQVMPKNIGGLGSFDVHFLEKNGSAKVLASPNILCRSGKSASFFAGGEFPIKILNYKVQDVVWKKYGIILNVKPVADFSGKMSISIETEVSSIDKSRSIDGLPALFSNKIQSHFELNGSRTIALSGLIKNEQGENSSGLPGLSRLPVIGALFGSKEFIDNRTELVVFVKPEVVSPGTLEANL